MATTTHKEQAMSTDPKSVNWHGEDGQRFAFIDHAANSYTIREDNGYDIYIDIDGDDVHISWQPVVSAALGYIIMHGETISEVVA
jgi:hypothetical protein